MMSAYQAATELEQAEFMFDDMQVHPYGYTEGDVDWLIGFYDQHLGLTGDYLV